MRSRRLETDRIAGHSPPSELHDTGLTHYEVLNKHSRAGGQGSRSTTNPSISYHSNVLGSDHSSIVSRSSGALGGRSRVSSEARRPDSPPPNATEGTPPHGARIASGVSGLSERDAGHLRQISEGTVSLTSDQGDRGVSDHAASDQQPFSSPVSPPSAGERVGGDYMSLRQPVSPTPSGPGSPLRRSVFHENHADLEDRP